MKDKTAAMNMGLTSEQAEKGYGNAGRPMSRRQYKDRQMADAGLLDDVALQRYENHDGDEGNTDAPRGFLPRNNYDDRF